MAKVRRHILPQTNEMAAEQRKPSKRFSKIRRQQVTRFTPKEHQLVPYLPRQFGPTWIAFQTMM